MFFHLYKILCCVNVLFEIFETWRATFPNPLDLTFSFSACANTLKGEEDIIEKARKELGIEVE